MFLPMKVIQKLFTTWFKGVASSKRLYEVPSTHRGGQAKYQETSSYHNLFAAWRLCEKKKKKKG
jgi:hypothetical protein